MSLFFTNEIVVNFNKKQEPSLQENECKKQQVKVKELWDLLGIDIVWLWSSNGRKLTSVGNFTDWCVVKFQDLANAKQY